MDDQSHTSGGPALRVLWADPDVEFVRPLLNFLNTRGCVTTLVMNGRAAHDAIRSGRYDVVILEWRLPDTCGVDVLRILGSHASDTPLVVLSRWATLEIAREAGALGARIVRRKPLDCVELLTLVRSVARTPAATPVTCGSWTERAYSVIETAVPESILPTRRRIARMLTESDTSILETAAGMRVFSELTSPLVPAAHRAARALTILDDAQSGQRRVDSSVAQVMVMFESSAGRPLHETAVARTLCISSAHLGRLLFAQTKLSWRDWNATSRFREVFRELRVGCELLKIAALTHHWSSYEHFCRQFRARMGTSARDFRLLLRSDDDLQVHDRCLQVSLNRSGARCDIRTGTVRPCDSHRQGEEVL